MSLVSTIIPVFNRPVMIRESVRSVLAQTYRPIEIIIVDDGSTDETPGVLKSLSVDHPEVKVLHQANAGPGVARNTGLNIAQGEFIQYLDSDDVLHPEKFEKQVCVLRSTPYAGVCYCITHRKDAATGQMAPWARTAEKIDNIFPSFLPKRGWATLTPLWRRSVCDAIGPWKPFRVMEDWEHDLRAGLLGVKPVHVPEVLCTVIDHEQNRASGMNEGYTKNRIQSLFLAHESVWLLMRNSGQTDSSYLKSLGRTMFWIGRMCGRRGLVAEAERALAYADQMAELHGEENMTAGFRHLTRFLGWRLSAWIVDSVSRIRQLRIGVRSA